LRLDDAADLEETLQVVNLKVAQGSQQHNLEPEPVGHLLVSRFGNYHSVVSQKAYKAIRTLLVGDFAFEEVFLLVTQGSQARIQVSQLNLRLIQLLL